MQDTRGRQPLHLLSHIHPDFTGSGLSLGLDTLGFFDLDQWRLIITGKKNPATVLHCNPAPLLLVHSLIL